LGQHRHGGEQRGQDCTEKWFSIHGFAPRILLWTA
jgi:hypothetical protein